jgi:membrane protease YdiL (CAAX protease family)
MNDTAVNPEPAKPTLADLAVVAVAIVLPSITTWLYFFGAAGSASGVQATVYSVVKVAQFALPAVWVLLVQKQRLTLRPRGSEGVAVGLLFGVAVAAGMFGLYKLVLDDTATMDLAEAEIRRKTLGFGIDTLAEYALLGGFYSLIHSLLEEYYWRWFVFGQLRRCTSFRAAAIVSSLGFMAHHVLVLGKFFGFASPTTYLLSACIAVGGFVWAWLYERTGSLMGPWLSHAVVDAGIFALGYQLVRTMLAT